MQSINVARHQGIVDLSELEEPVTIIGAGSVGSYVTLTLAKMGCSEIRVIDFDKVEPHNIGCQLYGQVHTGQYKVTALADLIYNLTDSKITHIGERFQDVMVSAPTVILALDSIEARREFFEYAQRSIDINHIIDARMGGETMTIYTVDMSNDDAVKRYERSLQHIPVEIPCTERSIVYNVAIIAGLVGNQYKRLIKGQPYSSTITFSLPDLTFITAPLRGGDTND